MADDFRLNDPVTIESTGSTADADPLLLEGIVAHLGPVQFAPGNDWVGIRLTGASVGKGKNDGSVKGVHYFDAGANSTNNGMFAKKNNVKKRSLSRLEELRLRRELSEAGSAGVAAGASGSSSRSTTATASSAATEGVRTRSRAIKSPVVSSSSSGSSSVAATALPSGGTTTPRKSVGASPAPATSVGGKAGGTSKLEELRAKREALARERGSNISSSSVVRDSSVTTPTASTRDTKEVEVSNDEKEVEIDVQEEAPSASVPSSLPKINLQSATPGYRAELSRLQEKISKLEGDLKKKTIECTSLQSSLDFMSRGAEQSTHDAVRMYAMGALALTEAKKSGSTPMTASRGATATPGKDTPDKGGRRSLDAELKLEESKVREGGEKSGTAAKDTDEDDDEEEDEDDTENEVINQAAAAVSQALVERNNELKQQLSDLTSANVNLQNQLIEAEERISNVTTRFEQATENYRNEKQARSDELKSYNADKSVLTSQIGSLERELKVVQERVSDKSSMQDHSHAALAKLRAELTSLQRKNEELENDKMELESTLEELVLDKEQLGQEKEMIEDQLEEMKIDLESTQLELEDAKAQLESDRAAEASALDDAVAGGGATPDAGASTATAADQDVTRSLTLQNTRLRTALIRLREQSELERNQLQRQIKTYQSDSTSREELQAELESLKTKHASTLFEVKELKDMIDQTSALEETIEILSDKVWNLEEKNADLNRTIRELEESAEIAAEMEEVQAEELKMLLRDLEGRDALVRNLEEAIRMQRRREEDFQRYVSEFRTSISTLKREKAALLAHTDYDQGEKSHLLATSKKALAQAAQLASDAAEARRWSSEAAFHKICARSATYLSQRLEMLLPSGVASAEIAAVHGEMSLAKVADMASVSLLAVEEIFNKSVEKGSAAISEFNTLNESESMVVTDAVSQQIAVMTHCSDFAQITIEVATDALRLMAAGQWPDLLSKDLSTDLGGVVTHTIADLDMALSEQLQLLKSDGALSPLRSSLTYLDQSAKNARLALFSATDENGSLVVPTEWKPPGWEALKNISLGRFACLGAAAVLSSAVSPIEDSENEPPPATPKHFADVVTKTKQGCSFMLDICKNLAGLQLNDTDTLNSLDELSCQYYSHSKDLYECISTTLDGESITIEDVDKFSSLMDSVLSSAKQIAALVRKTGWSENDNIQHHYLSAEYEDSWGGITTVVSQARILDGDAEDVNYLMRARAIENLLEEAVQNEPKLVIANSKIASLEKSLSSRAKENLLQQQNLAELDTLLAKAASVNAMMPLKGPKPTTPSDSSGDKRKLTVEVQQLQEALDMAHKQSDEYAKEIRLLKDKSRTPRGVRTAGGRMSPKKSSSMDLETTLTQFGQAAASNSSGLSSRDVLLESISLETALFRPALSSAMQSSSYWKAKAMGSALSKLTPLNVSISAQSFPTSTGDEARNALGDIFSLHGVKNQSKAFDELALARNQLRLTHASLSIVDLSKNDVRAQLNRERRKMRTVESRLQNATSCC